MAKDGRKNRGFVMTIEELFAHSVCISDSPERREIMRHSFAFAGLPIPPMIRGMRIAAVYGDGRKYYHRGTFCAPCCTAAHLQCINMAEFLGWPFVCIFEDDAWPCLNCRTALEKELANIPESGVRFIGWCARTNDLFYGTHAYVVFADCYQIIRDAVTCDKLECLNFDVVFSTFSPLSSLTCLSD